MATSALPQFFLLLILLAATASARPCKTLFYFTATTTTTYYPYNSVSRNPNADSIFHHQSPRYLTLIFTSTANRLPDRPLDLASNSDEESQPSFDSPLKFYSSVSSSIRDRTKDIMSVIGALLFGVGCGVLTAAVMYFVWALCSPRRFEFEDVLSSGSDDDDDDDDVATIKRKLGYAAISTNPKADDDDDLTKPAPPTKEREEV